MTASKSIISNINDAFRARMGRGGGRPVITRGIMGLPDDVKAEVFKAVRSFSDFTKGDDPYGEHDFGAVKVDGCNKVFWKIDYYDKSMDYGSPDPANSAVTTRVLTVMLAEEY